MQPPSFLHSLIHSFRESRRAGTSHSPELSTGKQAALGGPCHQHCDRAASVALSFVHFPMCPTCLHEFLKGNKVSFFFPQPYDFAESHSGTGEPSGHWQGSLSSSDWCFHGCIHRTTLSTADSCTSPSVGVRGCGRALVCQHVVPQQKPTPSSTFDQECSASSKNRGAWKVGLAGWLVAWISPCLPSPRR